MEKENNKSKTEDILKKIKENLDLIISSAGVLLGIFIIYLSQAYGIHQQNIGGAIFIASALYLLLRGKFIKTSETFHFKPTRNFIYINNIIFFLALSLSVWLLYSILYYRPTIYFILVAVACASIALEIFYSSRKWTGIILIKILLIGITLYGGIYYEFDGIFGNDTRYHNPQTAIYIEKGQITQDGPEGHNPYYFFPMFHVLAASTSILTSLSVYDSIFSSIGFLFIFSAVFVFLIGQKLINTRIGLLAALMLIFGDYRILFGTMIIPMTLGVVFFTIILYLFIVNTSEPIYKRGIALALSIVLILTHAIAGAIMFVTLILSLIWKNISTYLNNISSSKLTVFWSTTIVFGVMLVAYWMYAFRQPGELSLLNELIHQLYSGLTHDAKLGVTEKISYYAAASYFEYFIDRLGYVIFLGMGIIGTYIWFRDKDEFKTTLCITMVGLFVIIYGFGLFNVRTILSDRWFCFVYIILALVSAYGMFKLVSLINKKFRKIAIVIIIFLMSFFMITSTLSNNDNPLYRMEHSERGLLGDKTSELQGTATIHQIFNVTYGPLNWNIGGYNLINPDILSPDYNFSNDTGKLCVLPKDAFKYPMYGEKIHYGVYKPFILDNEFKIRLESNSNEIYDNGEIWGYLIKEKNNNE